MNVTPVIVVPGMEFTTVQGIMTYSFSNMKLLPRNNNDMVLATSVKSAESSTGLRLHPNPASNKIKITVGNSGKHQIKVLNSLGRQMMVLQIEGMETELDIRNLPAGIYHLSVSDAQGKITGTRSLSVY
jgi:hypothetical protein